MSSLEAQEACDHLLAARDTHKCPGCNGIMRRCCQSTLGCHHDIQCKLLEAAMKEAAHISEHHGA